MYSQSSKTVKNLQRGLSSLMLCDDVAVMQALDPLVMKIYIHIQRINQPSDKFNLNTYLRPTWQWWLYGLLEYTPVLLLVMSLQLVAHMPGLVCWLRRTTAINRIIIMYHIIIFSYHIISSYYHMTSSYQDQAATK